MYQVYPKLDSKLWAFEVTEIIVSPRYVAKKKLSKRFMGVCQGKNNLKKNVDSKVGVD